MNIIDIDVIYTDTYTDIYTDNRDNRDNRDLYRFTQIIKIWHS